MFLFTAAILSAGEKGDGVASRASGPFLRVSIAREEVGQSDKATHAGVVFRIGVSHPYRPAGSLPPAAAGHLSRVFTRAPDPPKALPQVVVEAESDKDAKNLILPKLPDGAGRKTDDLDALLRDTFDVDSDRKVKKEKKSKSQENSPSKPAARQKGKPHTEEEKQTPAPARQLRFRDRGSDWMDVAACRPDNRLAAGEAAALLDLHPLLPKPMPANDQWPATDRAVVLYVRAFAGSQLRAARVRLKLELFRTDKAAEPIAATTISSGFFGMRLTDPRGERPRFETEEQLRKRWRERTKAILAKRSRREYFVGSKASPFGKGTRTSPIALQTLLRSPRVRPGDTIWLLEGKYPAPAHVHPALPPEVAPKSEVVKPPTLPDEIRKSAKSADSDLDKLLGAKPGDKNSKTVKRYYFTSPLKGRPDNPIIVRAWPGHRVRLEGGLQIQGAHTWYWGFEVGEVAKRANSRQKANRLTINGSGCRLINMHFHGHREGPIYVSRDGWDVEIYGCIVHNIGYWPKTNPYSEGFSPGIALGIYNAGGVFRVTDNIVFDNFGVGIQFPMSDEPSHNFVLEGNFVFASGAKGKHPTWSAPNVALNWHIPFWRTFLVDNVLHQRDTARENLFSVAYSPLLGWASGEIVMRNNIFDGGRVGLEIGNWNHLRVTGNTIRAVDTLFKISPTQLPPDSSTWDGNTYVLRNQTATLERPPMKIWGQPYDLRKWQERLKFDTNGTLKLGNRLPQPRVVVRPNHYEPHRAHVAVVGWGDRQNVAVELGKVLKLDQQFAVYNVRDLSTPVLTSRFVGKPVQLPRGESKQTPQFDAYVVEGRTE